MIDALNLMAEARAELPSPRGQSAADEVRSQLSPPALPIAAVGPALEVVFPAANTPRDVPHGLGVTPDGYFIVLESGGLVQAVNVSTWTPDVAWLQANTANTRVRLFFYSLQERAIIHVVV